MNMWQKVRKLKSNQPQQPISITPLRQPQNPAQTARQEDLLSTFHPRQSGNNQSQKQLLAHQRHSSHPTQPARTQEFAPTITLNGHSQTQNPPPTAHLHPKQPNDIQKVLSSSGKTELQQGRGLFPHTQSLNKPAVALDWLATSTFADLETPAEDIVEMSVIESQKEENEVIDLDELSHHHAAQSLPLQRQSILEGKGSQKLGSNSSQGQSSLLGRKASKLKLRDYIYMVESTSRHSLSKGKNSSESLTLEKKQAKEQEANSLAKTSRESAVLRRREQSGSKYSVPSAEMVEIIKKEVKTDIARISEQLCRIDAEMQAVQPESEQQSIDRQLLCLYQVRRQVKEEISKRIEATLALLVGHKGAISEGRSWTEKQSSFLSNKL